MNAKQRLAAMHARELRYAKDALMKSVNRQIQSFKQQGYNAEVTPQILTMLNTQQYRLRDVLKMNRLVANPEKLKEYILASDSETGEVVSGERAIERYNRYATSKIRKPAKETDIVLENFTQAVSDQFVDETAYREFADQLEAFSRGDFSNVSDADWGGLRNEHDRNYVVFSNQNNVTAIRAALDRAIQRRGLLNVMKAINTAPRLMDNLTAAAVSGYKEKAGIAVSEILDILNPDGSAFEMGNMQDTYESQYYEDFEE